MPQQNQGRGPYPRRVVNLEDARRRFGTKVDEILPWLWRDDPLADRVAVLFREQPGSNDLFYRVLERGSDEHEALPLAIENFFDEIQRVPDWVDWDLIDQAGELFFRTGLAGGIVLGAKSLCYGYCSPGGNKPLIMTGRLSGAAMNMRLAETSRYVVETCRRGGLRRYAQGFLIAVRVRIMHAVVRDLLKRNELWSDESWGLPINQHDMLGTAMLFSQSFIEGIRQFGFSVSDREAHAYLHLWRYATHIMGLDESLFPKTEAEAMLTADIILFTQGAPDEDARRLVDALVRSPLQQNGKNASRPLGLRAQVSAGYGFCRTLLGDELADGLGLPDDAWRYAIPVISKLITPLDSVRRRVSFLHSRITTAGLEHWERAIADGSGGKRARFSPPSTLDGIR